MPRKKMSSPANIFAGGVFQQLLIFLLYALTNFAGASADELQILLNLKSALSKSNTDVFNSWIPTTSPCNFTGISCSSDRFVSEIDLPKKQLVGTLPLDSVCQLQSLKKLNLASNSLYGVVTDDLQSCSKLTYLDLSLNSFTGSMPDFSNLTGLSHLNLNKSGFSGPFPWKSLEKLTNLEFLSVGDNPLEKSQFPVEVVKLNRLNWLYLSNCTLAGEIPADIGTLTELANLELSSNQLTGEIPADIGKLKKLWQLELYNNQLTGKIPVGFRNLTNLQKFDASTNKLEGDLSELKFLTNLVSLQLFENNFSGQVPEEFGDFRSLVNLSLYTNKLTGPLPQKLGSWADFFFIDVSENNLTGPIPPDMCKQGKMTKLLVLKNSFTGEIPATYANCLSMTRIRLSNNALSGVVPAGVWGLPNLDFIDLDYNQFEGTIAPEIANAKVITQIHIANNRFSGQLPPEIVKATSLVLIDLSYNQFSGEFPSDIGRLKRLNSIYLKENKFTGDFPDSILSCSYLNIIDFAGNLFSGRLPSNFGSLQSLNSLNLSRNQFSGRIPESLSSLKLSLLDLSHNRLSGRIPQSLSSDAYSGSFFGNPELCSPTIRTFRPCPSDSGMSNQLRTILSCLLVGMTVVLIALAAFIFIKKRTKDNQERNMRFESWDVKSFRVLNFTEQEILSSIKQENLIGKGGSGNVYRVVLDNGKELAVKHIWNSDQQTDRKSSRSSAAMLMKRSGNLPEFDAEVATLSSIRHVNVVKLYCSITSEDSSLLVYEYLPNGSLWDRLHTCKKVELDWETRYEIALGAAKGLEYLHHGCDRPVIHRDVKSSNILLDEFLKPRIADFGLAKIVQATGGKDSTHVIAGTHGYIAPEYAYTYKVNEKSDVYSFGVVLMELVTGKRPIEPEYGENKDIVYLVCCRISSNKESVMDLVDTSIPEDLKEDAVKVLRVAVLCTARLPALRPSMRAVVQMLEDAEPCQLRMISIDKSDSGRKKFLDYSTNEKPKQSP